ncbi:MAG: GNAT family N-acetyltransferase, partial [Burkholderiaceae bacterium]|nr:GNAT family N-acetyltransferase [Burkholderiaceae bacterium]
MRSLTSRHRDRLREHLLALDERDRYLRFGFSATDAQIVHYTDTLDFDRDEVFGIFNRRLDLIAMAHLAYAPAPQIKGQAAMAE